MRSRRYKKRAGGASLTALFLLVVMVSSLFFAYIYMNGLIKQQREYRRNQIQLQQQLERVEAENLRLEKAIEQMGSPEFVKEIARSELGMVGSDEIVFVDNSID